MWGGNCFLRRSSGMVSAAQMHFNSDDLTESRLRENAALWNSRLGFKTGVPKDGTPLAFLPTTHTFSFARVLIGKSSDRMLYQKILFDDRALLSSFTLAAGDSTILSRTIGPRALAAGLDKFVFSYLGIHNPFYCRGSFPGFGVFIRVTEEVFPKCNATRRNLSSPEVSANECSSEFLLPTDVRELVSNEVESRHSGDVWRYWGHPDYWTSAYALNMWQWLAEFHFVNRIGVESFEGILWPNDTAASPSYSGRMYADQLREDHRKFRQQFETCQIITYKPSKARPITAFVKASYDAAFYYATNRRFPEFV
jgi:hypothetical protein